MAEQKIVIAARPSMLSRTQAEQVGRRIAEANPRADVEHVWIRSEGDQVTGPLAAAGGKGLFAKAIEAALLDGAAHVAVHSLKDLPGVETPGLCLAAIPTRVDPRDALIARHGIGTIDALPERARVGTASPRRAAQLRMHRPDLDISLMRGNIETRLRKVHEDRVCDATLLAMAGMLRAGFDDHAKHPLAPEVMLPAAGQGAVAIQCRADDHATRTACLSLNDPISALAVHAERAVVKALAGDCHSPIAVYAELLGQGRDQMRLRALVVSPDGRRTARADLTDDASRADQLVAAVVATLDNQAARDILHDATENHSVY